jgi:hypothetical protein
MYVLYVLKYIVQNITYTQTRIAILVNDHNCRHNLHPQRGILLKCLKGLLLIAGYWYNVKSVNPHF